MIIECKNCKTKFKIPKQELSAPGRDVICEICNQEWYQHFTFSSDITFKGKAKSLDLLDKINPSKTKENIKQKNNKNRDHSLLLITSIFIIIIIISYILILKYRNQILILNPNLINFYESLEIMSVIIKAYIIFLSEILSEKFVNL